MAYLEVVALLNPAGDGSLSSQRIPGCTNHTNTRDVMGWLDEFKQHLT